MPTHTTPLRARGFSRSSLVAAVAAASLAGSLAAAGPASAAPTPAPSPTTASTASSTTQPGPVTAGTRSAPLDLTGQGSWIGTGTARWFRLADGSYPVSGWVRVQGQSHLLGADGYVRTGWVQEAGSWLLLDRTTGALRTGWVADGGRWYYLGTTGAMATGWVNDGRSWYLLTTSGAMLTGWQQADGAWYLLGDDGAMRSGWQQVSGRWYYLGTSGAMMTGWVRDGSSWYHLSTSGSMDTGWYAEGATWYYLTPSGAMATGWVSVSGTWYYLDTSGAWVPGQSASGYLQPSASPDTSARVDTSNLVLGSTGTRVRLAQQRLGFSTTTTLARVDAAFQTAVRNFQRRVGLPQTGVVDKATWDALGTGYPWDVETYAPTPVPISATSAERVEAMISFAMSQVGSPYTWGGIGPYALGYDCSGLTLTSLFRAGMAPPGVRTAQQIYDYSGFRHVPFTQRKRGDLIFYRTNGQVTHVSIYLGNDQVVHTDWMDMPARVDGVATRYATNQIDAEVVRPFS